MTSDDDVQQRLDRWKSRDAAVGLSAEVDQLRAAVAERDNQLADMRERIGRLAQQNAQLTQQRDQLANRADAVARPAMAGRVYRGVRRIGGKVLRRVGLR
jgi:uncharacterized coiled-coil DUF342 family protein